MRLVACAGLGPIGRGWAVVFAAAGYAVRVYDHDQKIQKIAVAEALSILRLLENHGLVRSAASAHARITACGSLEAAVAEADYIQESLPEDLSVKRRFVDAMAQLTRPDAILASSTSALMPSQFLDHPVMGARSLVAHPTNPPFLLRFTEVCPGPHTTPEVLSAARALLESAGQVVVDLAQEVPGFILNRLQAAVIDEALDLVGRGMCSPADIDRAMTTGLGPRWAVMGPLLAGHLNAPAGYRDYMTKYHAAFAACLPEGRTPRWTDAALDSVAYTLASLTWSMGMPAAREWRDRRLASLARHLHAEPDIRTLHEEELE